MTNIEDIVSTASTVKSAIISDWEKNEYFTDRNKMTSEGIMSDTIGLTTILLLATCFNEEPGFWAGGDDKKIGRIVDKTIEYVFNNVKEKGFTAEPLVDSDQTEDFFDKTHGYADAISWVLTSSVLVRYNQRKGTIKVDPETYRKATDLIKLSIKYILNSQMEDGTWGFVLSEDRCDPLCKPSLFFTYALSNSIADFFDYIVGEIKYVESNNDDDTDFEYKDKELLGELKDMLGTDPVEALDKARRLTGKWLVVNCLPNLPKLAECDANIDREILKDMAINPIEPDGYSGYLHLYNVYFIIDMMTLCYADKVFEDILKDKEQRDELSKIYEKKLSNRVDYKYFFGTQGGKRQERDIDDLCENYYKGYVEQAIQISKNKFMEASRTGTAFWDGERSELEIVWKHTDEDCNVSISQIPGLRSRLREPTLVPMFLRANIDFCYYVSEETDFSIPKRYDMMIKSRSMTDDEYHVKDLWDDLNYNLLITERSVEAIVDYYDYTFKFTKPADVIKSDLENDLIKIVDARIDEKLKNVIAPVSDTTDSRAVSPESAVSSITVQEPQAVPQAVAASNVTFEDISKILDDGLDGVELISKAFGKSSPEYRLLEVFSKLQEEFILKIYFERQNGEVDSKTLNSLKASFKEKRDEFISYLIGDCSSGSVNYVNMYKNLKKMKPKEV